MFVGSFKLGASKHKSTGTLHEGTPVGELSGDLMMGAHACLTLTRVIQGLLDKLSPPTLDHVILFEQVNSTLGGTAVPQKGPVFVQKSPLSWT